MIQGENTVVYKWFDIQDAISDKMGIPRNKFRDYHEIVGGDYKDLWHVALNSVVPDNMANGTIVRMYSYDIDFVDVEEWKGPFFEAYNAVMQELDPNDEDVWVSFSW